MAEIDGLLKMMSEQGSSDLHVKVGSPPAVRLNGRLVVLREVQVLSPEVTQRLAIGMMDDRQKVSFENHREVDVGRGSGTTARRSPAGR
jgi:twitching motility protein PilT